MPWLYRGLALLAGGGSVFAYAPFELFPLAFVSLAALYALLERSLSAAMAHPSRQGFLLGFAWGLGAMLAGVSWLYVALHRFGGMPAPLAALAVALFCAFMACYAGLAGALFGWLRRGRSWQDAPLFASLWLFSEWLRGWLFTGFPWLAVGYSQTPPSPLAGFAPVVGVYALGGLVALVAALGVAGVLRRDWRAGALVMALLLAGAGLGQLRWTAPVGAPLSVALVQTNFEQSLKWRPELIQHWLDENLAFVRNNPAQLVVLPETTIPMLVEHLPAGYLEALGQIAAANGGDVILGSFTRDAQGHIFNAAIRRGRSPEGHYAKQHLVPFGEYSPPLFDWFYALAHIPMADQTRGAANQPPLPVAGQQLAINICYEDVFGEELIRSLPEATLMLNLSNLAWYGDSFAQPQHLQIARLRALESGRPMLRATNTGMTAVIDPDGTVRAVLPAFQVGVLRADVQGHQGLTPYARWGNAPAVAAALIYCLGLIALRRRG